jgi:lysophospholipase L1-like esterase
MLRFALLISFLLALGCAPTPTGSSSDDDDDVDEPTPEPGPPADEDVNSFLPSGYVASDPARVVFLGDSITAGAGATSNGLDYPSLLMENDDEWPRHDDVDIESSYGDVELIDVSVGGATTSTLVSTQLDALGAAVGDVASGESIFVVTIGGNDMQQAIPQALFQGDAAAEQAIQLASDNIDTMIEYLTDSTRFPDGSFVYFANVYEPTDNIAQADECFGGLNLASIFHHFDNANAEFRELAEDRGVAMIDMRGHFTGHGFHSSDTSIEGHHAEDPTVWFASDCIHPNDRGHHEIRRLFHAAISGQPLRLEETD